MSLRNITNPLTSQLAKMKDLLAERRLFSRRAFLSLILTLGGLLSVVGRLIYLQVINHKHFTTLSENNRVKLQPLAPTRGLIYDRNGVLLAENYPPIAWRLPLSKSRIWTPPSANSRLVSN